MLLFVFNHQIVTVPEDDPGKDNWKTFVEDKPDVSCYILFLYYKEVFL